MTDQLVKRLLALTDILVETGDTGWANTTRAAAKRITEYDYDLVEAWEEGHHAGQHNEHEHRPRRAMTNPYRQETQA